MNIYQKLIEIRKAVPYLQKDSQMTQGQNYKYNSSSQVIGAVRKRMDELNILLITKIVDKRVTMDTIEYMDDRNNRPKRTTTYFTELDLIMVWVNGEEPTEIIEIPWYGQGIDTAGEKGVGKALTYAEKTFLLKEFNIATDQMDVDAFQNKIEETTGRADILQTNSIALIKSEWLGLGYKANEINAQAQKLYGCKLVQLTTEQADDFLQKLRDKKKGKEGESA